VSNIYWPVYRNLEKAVDDLAFAIHIDDSQLGVYSSRITDLILRAAAEIESLSKSLYKAHGGTETGEIKFDDVALKHLKNLWLLDKKKIVLSSSHCFQTCRILTPFVKNETRTSSPTGKQTFSWNNAYQNLKHDRGNSMRFGSVKYLFDIMAALFILNVYYRNETIQLDKDSAGVNFEASLGSTLFSVEFVANPSHGPKGNYIRPAEFDSAIYYVVWTPETGKVFQESMDAFNSHNIELFFKHPKMIEYIMNNDVSNYGGNLAWDVLGQDECIEIMRESARVVPIKGEQLKCQAMLNMNTA
jgi:hypothetical protein